MGVCLKSDIWRFMAEPFGNQYRVGSKVDQCRCVGVPEIVDADRRQSGSLGSYLHNVSEVLELLIE